MSSIDLSKLDDTNPQHWCEDGAPRLSTVRKLLGDSKVTRAQIKEAGRTRGAAPATEMAAAPDPFEIWEIFDKFGEVRSDMSDATLQSWPEEKQMKWAAVAATSIAAKAADEEETAARNDVSACMRSLQSEETRANAARIGRAFAVLSDADKAALRSPIATIREPAMARAAEVEHKNRTAHQQQMEHARIDELRRVSRANSHALADPAVIAEEAKARELRDKRNAEADGIMTAAESKLAAARTGLSVAHDEQRRCRAAVSVAVTAWQDQFPRKTQLDLAREYQARSQAERAAEVRGEIVPAAPAGPPVSVLDAAIAAKVLKNRARRTA